MKFKNVNWHSTMLWGIVGLVGAALITGAALMVAPHIDKDTPTLIWGYLAENAIALVTVILVLTLLVISLYLYLEIRILRKKLVAEVMPTFKRFENIKKIKYGHIQYRPLLYYGGRAEEPMGVGIELLERIFGSDRIQRSGTKALWSDLVDNLERKKYDIVATPLFETRERSKVIAFCSPLFYSDIGMYVKTESVLGKVGANSQSFDGALEILNNMKLTLAAIHGEISGKMAQKYLGDVKVWLTPETATVSSLIDAVSGEDEMKCDVAFAEVFQADQTSQVINGSVINILQRKQILYPVSFAVRKEEYVLRNYINLRLLEIEESYEKGVLGILWEELQTHPETSGYTFDDIKRYFVREFDKTGGGHDLGIKHGGGRDQQEQAA